jgi:hypothetical protein
MLNNQFVNGTEGDNNVSPRQDTDLEDATELLAMFPPLLQEAMQESEQTFNRLNPNRSTGPTEEDFRELGNLKAQIQQLTQPLPQRRAIGGRIQGNPFSLSVQGLSEGVNTLLSAVERKRRDEQLFGDPERRGQIESEIDSVTTRAKEMRQTAEEIRGGLISGEAMARVAGQPLDNEQLEAMATQVEQEADALEQEANVLNRKLQEYSGVSGKYYGKQAEVEQAQEDRNFRNQFINTFGRGLFDTTIQTMRTREQLDSLERREEIRQAGLTAREIVNVNADLEELRVKLKEATENAEPVEGDEVAPNEYKPGTIKQYARNFKNKLENDIEKMKADLTQDGQFTMDQARTGVLAEDEFDVTEEEVQAYRNKYQAIMKGIRARQEMALLADQVALSAEEFQNSVFDTADLPDAVPPNDAQSQLLESMKNAGMPLQMIKAYEYYNRIDPNAVPKVPDEARGNVGDYTYSGE